MWDRCVNIIIVMFVHISDHLWPTFAGLLRDGGSILSHIIEEWQAISQIGEKSVYWLDLILFQTSCQVILGREIPSCLS
jgi:hypothetical protein